MESQFGRGFITNIMLISKHFARPPNEAWGGVASHLTEMTVPECYKGTEIEELVLLLRKKVIWHQPGTLDKEAAADVIRVLNRLVVAIDRELGIEDPQIGKYD